MGSFRTSTLKENYDRITNIRMDDSLVESESKWKQGGEYRILQEKFKTMALTDIVPIVNSNTDWDYEKIAELVKELFIDANFHSEATQIYDFIMGLE